MTFDALAFRRALGSFPTGVTVIATRQADGTPRGFTANSFTSVSLNPPLVLFCLAKSAASHDVFFGAKSFSINILGADQRDVAALFATRSPDKFKAVAWRPGHTASPILEGVAAWLDCERHSACDGGDHTVFLGQVVDFATTAAPPLVYCRGGYVPLSLTGDAAIAGGRAPRVGAILEHRGGVLFLETAGGLMLPQGDTLGPPENRQSLAGVLDALGTRAALDFVYAVFEGRHGGLSVFYRGEAVSTSGGRGLCVIPMDDIPYGRIDDEAVRKMLARYVAERRDMRFGIYAGGYEHGVVKELALGLAETGAEGAAS
jgi:flavin reductase (DIM6/NTAB) family NADH-FMN oxidoreductase RutF